MSAALQLCAAACSAGPRQAAWRIERRRSDRSDPTTRVQLAASAARQRSAAGLAFYRKHTESILRRYLYASMQVGRAPSVLADPVGRGWASSRPIRSFEDAVIFVLDVERCLARLGALERQILSRIVLQEYTQPEAAVILGMSSRTICTKLGQALDRLTAELRATGLLVIPD